MSKFQRYLSERNFHNFEGYRGVQRLETIMREIGDYENMTEFLADNSGACEEIVKFIEEWTARNTEWKDNLDSLVELDEEDDE